MRSLINKTSMFIFVSVLVGTFLLLSPSDADAQSSRGERFDFTLTILHNNDGESQLINAPGEPDFGGIARFATLVDDLRREARQRPRKSFPMLLSSGDNFLAGPEFTASLENGIPHFDVLGLELIRYDAFAIGNHELDFGPDIFADFLQSFEAAGRVRKAVPFISANLDFTEEPVLQAFVDSGIIVKSKIIKRRNERIGVVGATTPLLASISSPRDIIVDPNVAERIQEQINALGERRVNKIILISHLQGVDEDLALAEELTGVDIMIAGGGDELLANEGDLLVPGDEFEDRFGPYPLEATGADGTVIPVVTTPGDYKYVGKLVVDFNRRGEVIKVHEDSGLVRVAGGDNPDAVEPDPLIQELVVDPVSAFVADLDANVIASSEVSLEGRREPGIRTQETNLGNLVADSLLFQANELAGDFNLDPADVALQNGGGIRNNNLIPAGDITELTTFDILPFSNFVAIVPDIPRAQFKEIMENAVSEAPAADGRFAQIAGFEMVYDPSADPGSRVEEIILDDGTQIVMGGAVVPGDALNIAIADFLARGGDEYPFNDAPFTTIGVSYQQALFNFITSPTGLNEVITAADYPEIPDGGGIRITTVP